MTTSGRSDEQLVAAAQHGDAAAMDELLRRHYDRVHAVCRRIAGGTRDADDAAQEAMIRVVRNLDSFDGRASFGTWVYRIATNTALDELAQRQVEGAADRLALDAALAELPEEFRVAVVMRDVGDLDYGEIAAALGVPVGTVKSRIARGRRLLLENLGNQEPSTRRPSTRPPDDP